MNYQEKVSTRADVESLFLKVKANPAIARYRGYTENKSYGWDEAKGDYIKADREVWFENPAFVAEYVAEGTPDQGEADLLDEQIAVYRREIEELQDEMARLQDEAEGLELAATEARALVRAAEAERDRAIADKEAMREVLERIAVLVSERLKRE